MNACLRFVRMLVHHLCSACAGRMASPPPRAECCTPSSPPAGWRLQCGSLIHLFYSGPMVLNLKFGYDPSISIEVVFHLGRL